MKFYYSLALATAALADDQNDGPQGGTRTINGQLHSQVGLYLRSYAPSLLSEFLDGDSNKVDDVLSHGCFCGKLDASNPYVEHLGGTQTLDELDEICRDWLRARNCNDNLIGGSCEADRESMRTGGYTMDITSDNYANSNCGFYNTECEEDTCRIDLQYAQAISQFMSDNGASFSPTVVNSAGACEPAPLDKRERKCLGDSPDVYPKRMSDLEQLFSRIDWIDDRDASDSAVYNEGGRKLNDDKESISLAVENQIITFNWPNVKSFTVKTMEDFNPYFVGWTEKANINNFQGQDTLGDNTKGGVQTIGIFSGDAMIRAHDGFEITQNDANVNFFNFENTVTCENDNGNFKFYVNGALVNSISTSGWEGAYPAIDTNARYAIDIVDVVFDE